MFVLVHDYLSVLRCEAFFCVMGLQIYNERRLFFGGGPGPIQVDSFGSASGPSADRRNSRPRGMVNLNFPPLAVNCLFSCCMASRIPALEHIFVSCDNVSRTLLSLFLL